MLQLVFLATCIRNTWRNTAAKCVICSALVNNRLDSSDHLLCYFKAYETTKQPFGGLTVPHTAFREHILKAEQLFVDTLPNINSKPGIGKQLISIISTFQIKKCRHFHSKFLVQVFVRKRLHYIMKFWKQRSDSGRVKGENKKVFHI